MESELFPTDEQVRTMLQVNDMEHERMKNMPQDVYDAQKKMRVKNPDWLAIRSIGGYLKRFTGSVIGALLGYNTYQNQNKALQELITPTFKGNVFTKWGQDHEADALENFIEWAKVHFNDQGVFVKEYGLVVDREKPWFGYSPDGEVHVPAGDDDDSEDKGDGDDERSELNKQSDGDSKGDGADAAKTDRGTDRYLLEIKCPYSKRAVIPESSEMYTQGEPLYGVHDWPDGNSGPVPVHYWFQMQLGFYTMNMTHGFFVIWNPYVTQVFHVQYSQDYVKNVMIPEATRVYWEMYLPRLRTHLVTREVMKMGDDDQTGGNGRTDDCQGVHSAFDLSDADYDREGDREGDHKDTNFGRNTKRAKRTTSAHDAFDLSDAGFGNDTNKVRETQTSSIATPCTIKMRVAGISYRKDACAAAMQEGPSRVTLEHEKTNKHDPNAVKVMINDKHHIGYVPKASQMDVLSMFANKKDLKVELDDLGTFTHGYYARVIVSGSVTES